MEPLSKLFWTLILIALFGAFGGFLYGHQQNGLVLAKLDRPRKQLELGWIGDCLVGVGGGIAIFLIIPTQALIGGGNVAQEVKILALATVGGFGGSAILNMALSVTVKDIRDRLDRHDATERNDALLLNLVDKQLSDTGSEVSESELDAVVKGASSRAHAAAFVITKQARHMAWRAGNLGVVKRTIPIFEKLVETNHGQGEHRYHAQLGYALKDQDNPKKSDLERAKTELERAIELYGTPSSPLYQLNWAICTMMIEEREGVERSDDLVRNRIVVALRTIHELPSENFRQKLWNYVFEQGSVPQRWCERNGVSREDLTQSTGA